MLFSISGKTLNFICDKPLCPEFPDLLVGFNTTEGYFFDPSLYLQKNNIAWDCNQFGMAYDHQIKTLMQHYSVDQKNLCRLDAKGNMVFNSILVYLFLSFVRPSFLAYCTERIDELFQNGFSVSDTSLMDLAANRLTPDLLASLNNDENTD